MVNGWAIGHHFMKDAEPLHRGEGQALAGLQKPQFRRPVHQRQAQALHVQMAGAQLSFQGRNLLAATLDSFSLLGVVYHFSANRLLPSTPSKS